MFWRKKKRKKVSFATSCYEKDWRFILTDPDYLKVKQIENHDFDFYHKILIINNVEDPNEVAFHAQKLVAKNILTHFFLAENFEEKMLKFFQLSKESFKADKGYRDSWVYYNATGVLSAIYLCKTPYLLFHTGDVFLEKKISWIDKAIDLMERYSDYKVANLLWNGSFLEAKKESYKSKKNFFISKSGFSDQQFLIKIEDFQKPIYNEIRSDSHHFPRGDVFEKRVFSFMKNRKWKRITYKKGSYTHISF